MGQILFIFCFLIENCLKMAFGIMLKNCNSKDHYENLKMSGYRFHPYSRQKAEQLSSPITLFQKDFSGKKRKHILTQFGISLIEKLWTNFNRGSLFCDQFLD